MASESTNDLLQSQDGDIWIEIADTTEGIDPKILSKIREPFFTTKAPGKGTGLSLSIAHNIVKDQSGGIAFKSEVDSGTKTKGLVKFPII